MNVVAFAENVSIHFRVPAVGLVTKVNTSFQQLTHRKIGQSHGSHLLLPVVPGAEKNDRTDVCRTGSAGQCRVIANWGLFAF